MIFTEPLERRTLLSSYALNTIAPLNTAIGASVGGVAVDGKGDIYGVSDGGTGGYGTVWEISAGQQSAGILANFLAPNTGSPLDPTAGTDPDGAPQLQPNGDIYGITQNADNRGYQTNVFYLAAGTKQIIDSEVPGNVQSLVTDSSGGLFGTAPSLAVGHYGGPLETFTATNLAVDNHGHLFGTEYSDGTNQTQNIVQIDPETFAVTVLATLPTANGSVVQALSADSKGDIFAVVAGPGQGNAAVYPTLVELPAGSHSFTTICTLNVPIYGTAGILGAVTSDSFGDLFGTISAGGIQGDGSLFEVPAGSHAMTTITTFDGTNGSNPTGTLKIDAHGDIFGITTAGGANDLGTAFELSPTDLVSSMLQFASAPASINSPGTVTVNVEDASDRIINGDTSTVQLSITSGPEGASLGGTVTTSAVDGIATFSGITFSEPGTYTLSATDGSLSPATWASITVLVNGSQVTTQPSILTTFPSAIGSHVVLDSTGDIFGTTPSTNTSAGSIFEIPAGTTTVNIIASFGPNDSTNTLGIDPGDLLIDSAGNLYGNTQQGGAAATSQPDLNHFYGGTLWELPKGSSSIQVIDSLQYSSNGSLSLDSSGDLFGTGFIANNPSLDIYVAFEAPKGGALKIFTESNFALEGATATSITSDAAGNAYILYRESITAAYEQEVPADTDGSTADTIVTFLAPPPGDLNPTGVVSDAAGNLFITGHAIAGYELAELKSGASAYTVLATLGDSATAGAVFAGPPVLDAEGDLFASTTTGGLYGLGTFVELPAGQSTFRILYSFHSPGDTEMDELTFAANGTAYGTLPYGDGQAIFKWADIGGPSAILPPSTNATIGLTPAIAAHKLPTLIVGGIRFATAVRVNLTPLKQGAATGVVVTKLFAVSDTDAISLGQISQRYRKGVRAIAGTFHIATSLPTGSYTLMAQSTDAAGNVVVGPAGITFTVSAPFVKVTATVAGITPKLHAGATGTIVVALINTGNVAASSPLVINITIGNGISILSQTLNVVVPARRRAIRVRLRFTVPVGTGTGFYAPVVAVTETGSTTSTTSAKIFRVI